MAAQFWVLVLMLLGFASSPSQGFSFPRVNDLVTPCTTKTGLKGDCRTFSECPSASEDIKRGRYPTVCAFEDGRSQLLSVCCPEADQTSSSTIAPIIKTTETLVIEVTPPPKPGASKNYLENFAQECGSSAPVPVHQEVERVPGRHSAYRPRPGALDSFRRKKRGLRLSKRNIVGGVNVLRNAYPWMALFGKKRGGEYDWFCAGSLISDRHILTAAHCFTTVRKPDIVRLGEHNLKLPTESPHQDMEASAVHMYPDFSAPAVHHDIAIVELRKPVKIDNFIRPVCMPMTNVTPSTEGVRGIVTGWGTTSFGGRSSDILQEVSVPIVNKAACEAAYQTAPNYEKNFPVQFPRNLICASEEEGGKDACQGDSGGPFMVKAGEQYHIIGVVSAGQGCGSKSYPGLYTWIYPYIQWIYSVVNK